MVTAITGKGKAMKEKIFKLLDGFTTPVMVNGERLVYWKIPMKQLSRKLADFLLANGVTIPVKCKDCKHFDEHTKKCYVFSHDCIEVQLEVDGDHFCSFGERRAE